MADMTPQPEQRHLEKAREILEIFTASKRCGEGGAELILENRIRDALAESEGTGYERGVKEERERCTTIVGQARSRFLRVQTLWRGRR
jgi:hypothetical protein